MSPLTIRPEEPSGAPDLASGNVEEPPPSAQPLRPARVGGGDEGLAPRRHLLAEQARSLLVQLRVQVVEEGHRGAARLRTVDGEGGQGQGQEEAPGLPGGGRRSRLLAIHGEPDLVPVGADQAPSRPPLLGQPFLDLPGESRALLLLPGAAVVGETLDPFDLRPPSAPPTALYLDTPHLHASPAP